MKVRRLSIEQWQSFVEAWQVSGLSQAKFCKEQGISKDTFWRKKKLCLQKGLCKKMTVKETHWEQVLSAWEKSGLDRKTFCSQNNLSLVSFYGWLRKLRPDKGYTYSVTKQKKWETLIKDWMESELTQKEFCQQKDLSLRQFQFWKNNLYVEDKRALERWQNIIKEWQQCEGVNKATFCVKRNLNVRTLNTWLRKLNPEDKLTKPTPNQKLWEVIIQEWRASGLTQKDFCIKRDITFPTFTYWKKKILT